MIGPDTGCGNTATGVDAAGGGNFRDSTAPAGRDACRFGKEDP